MDPLTVDEKKLAKYFDHTLLAADASEEKFKAFVADAKEMGVKMLAINSCQVLRCKGLLGDSDIHVGAAIGFPLGQTSIDVKVFETIRAIEDGCDEIDYVINIGKVKDKDYAYIQEEMETIVGICLKYDVLSKVIFENCYLEKEEIIKLSEIAKQVRPDFIKTSTGFGPSGATFEDVALMVQHGGGVRVKAAGGVRDWETCKKMIELGATRIGTSSSRIILAGFKEAREL